MSSVHMGRRNGSRRFSGDLNIIALVVCSGLGVAQVAVGQPCEVIDNGSGTIDLPPQTCGYVSPDDFHVIIEGLLPPDPGTTIVIDAAHQEFYNILQIPGGPLGGEVETFSSILVLQMTGTGALAGFNRVVAINADCEVHTGPRTPGDPIQMFPNDMFRLQGGIFGDPDFDSLQITAGTDFGLPSPGQTTLTQLPSGNWNVDSFFDITYQIDFVGAPGSMLNGMAGVTQAVVRMGAGEPAVANEACCGVPGAACLDIPPADCDAAGGTPQGPGSLCDSDGDGVDDACGNPCEVFDDGTGTVNLPPVGCQYLSPDEVHQIIDGLPAGTTIELAPIHKDFICRNGGADHCGTPGGDLGGEVEVFDSTLQLELRGTGDLLGFQRSLSIPVFCMTHTGPRTPGEPVQTFPTDMFMLQGELFGDPDFDTLTITGGTGNGLPSPGETTLTLLPGKRWAVDSFFDVEYRIDFTGAPGGQLAGLAGSTTGTLRMQSGEPAAAAIPTVSEWGMAVMALLVLIAAGVVIRRKRVATA